MKTKEKLAFWGIVGGVSLGLSFMAACSAGTGTRGTEPGAGGASSGNGMTSGGAGMGGEDILIPSASGSGSTSSGIEADASCASVSSEAQADLKPADIIIAVDTSGSMDEETAQVQQNLNNFAQIITASGIDVHVVLIAASNMCIPAPLGSGSCNGADEKLPTYRHVVQTVNSSDGLQVILSSYPQWKDSLRPNATKTIAIVTDDDSDMGATAFMNNLVTLDPTFTGFKFDAIAAPEGPDACIFGGCFFNCLACANPCCNKADLCSPYPAAEGKVYKQLVQQTGGVFGNLCIQNFDPVFQDMAKAVVSGAQISCEYNIPTPPDGQTIDPKLINVVHTSSGGTKTTIYNVPNGAMGCGNTGGWYFDDPAAPKKIVICANTCTALQSDVGGKVEVLFGCETEVKVPE